MEKEGSSMCPFDAFRMHRKEDVVLDTEFAEERIRMLLSYQGVKEAARNWETFSSDGKCKVPVPSEAEVRSVQQYPIETDPPEHGAYRAIIEPFFRRPLQEEFKREIERLMEDMLLVLLDRNKVEIVDEFALPIQSIALTHLLNVPLSWADDWIKWGANIYLDGGEVAEKKGKLVERYILKRLDEAVDPAGADIFSVLNHCDFNGRKLSSEEKLGTMVLIFAGGRDTIINSISSVIHYFAEHPEHIYLLKNDKDILRAAEEFFRVFSPLTQIGRWCPARSDIGDHYFQPGERIALSWAAANYDPQQFDRPEEILLDRSPNAHLAFGSGIHQCIGAHHARLIIRVLIQKICQLKLRFEVLDFRLRVEREMHFERVIGFQKLRMGVWREGSNS